MSRRQKQQGGANCDDYINSITQDIVSLTNQINRIKTEKPTNSKMLQTNFIDFFWEKIFNPFKVQIMDDPMCEVSETKASKFGESLDLLSLAIDEKRGYLTNYFQESYGKNIPDAIQTIKSHTLVLTNISTKNISTKNKSKKNKSKKNKSNAVALKLDSKSNNQSRPGTPASSYGTPQSRPSTPQSRPSTHASSYGTPPSKSLTPPKLVTPSKPNTPTKTQTLVSEIDSLTEAVKNKSLSDKIIDRISKFDKIKEMNDLSHDDYVLIDAKINILKTEIKKNPSELFNNKEEFSDTVSKLNDIQKFLFDKTRTPAKEKSNPYKKGTTPNIEIESPQTEEDKLIEPLINDFKHKYRLHLGLLQDKPILESLVSAKFHGIQLFNESKLSDFEEYKKLTYYVFCVVGLFNKFLKASKIGGIKFVIKGGKALQFIQPKIQYVSDDIDILVLYEPPITENYVIALITGFSSLFKTIPGVSILKIKHDKLLKISYNSTDNHIKVISDVGWKQPDEENIFFNDIKETKVKYTYDDDDTTYNFHFVYYHQSVDSFFREKRFYYEKYLEMQQGECNCDPKETKPQPSNCKRVCSTRDHFLKKFEKYVSVFFVSGLNRKYIAATV
jgi:hypothetical protein